MPRLRRRQCSGDGGRRLAEERARPADLDRYQGAKLRRRRPEAERGSIDAEALELLCGEVDPVELVVDPDVPDEVRQLERDTEPRERLGLSSRTEDDGHDAADRRRAPVHVAVEIGPRRDANTATVDPHRPHVDAQLVEGKLEAETGVSERSDHRVIRRPCRQPAFELALPRVEGGEPRGGLQRAARARRRSRPRRARTRTAHGRRVEPRPEAAAPRGSRWGRGGGAAAGTRRRPRRAAPGKRPPPRLTPSWPDRRGSVPTALLPSLGTRGGGAVWDAPTPGTSSPLLPSGQGAQRAWRPLRTVLSRRAVGRSRGAS